MTVSPNEPFNLAAGCIFLSGILPQDWPPAALQIIYQVRGTEGMAELGCTPTGAFRLVVSGVNDRPVAATTSGTAHVSGGTPFVIAATWEGANASIRLNGVIIADSRTGSSLDYRLPERTDLPPATAYDFSSENSAALAKRRGRLTDRTIKPNRVAGPPERMFTALQEELLALADLIEHAKAGRIYHILGIAARLRLLIAAGSPLPALQACASLLDMPLIVYTASHPRREMPLDLRNQIATGISRDIAAEPDKLFGNPVDIDVWLTFTIAYIGNNSRSNLDLLKDIGDTRGAHIDPDIPHSVDALSRLTGGIGQVSLDSIALYLISVSEVVLILGERLINARNECSPLSSP